MAGFHISQDETGFWQMAYEDDAGGLRLVAHQYNSPDHLIHDAHELVASGQFPTASVIVAPPRSLDAAPAALAAEGPARTARADYRRPAPRRAV